MVTEFKRFTGKHSLYPVAEQVHTFTFDPLPLQLGGQFGPVTLAYETWGTLNAAGDNAVLIEHALTGNSHAHDAGRPDDTRVAWWNPLIGPGRGGAAPAGRTPGRAAHRDGGGRLDWRAAGA